MCIRDRPGTAPRGPPRRNWSVWSAKRCPFSGAPTALRAQSALRLTRDQACGLAPDHDPVRRMTVLPAGPFQRRRVVLRLRIAEAQKPDEHPSLRHLQNLGHARGIEDRHPAEPDPFGARMTEILEVPE